MSVRFAKFYSPNAFKYFSITSCIKLHAVVKTLIFVEF